MSSPDLRPTTVTPCGPPRVVIHHYPDPVQRWTVEDGEITLIGEPATLDTVIIGSIWTRLDGATVVTDRQGVSVVLPTTSIARSTKL